MKIKSVTHSMCTVAIQKIVREKKIQTQMTESEQQLRQEEEKNKMQWKRPKQFAFFKIQIYMQFSFFFRNARIKCNTTRINQKKGGIRRTVFEKKKRRRLVTRKILKPFPR